MPNGFLHFCFLVLCIFNYKTTSRSHLRISERKTGNPNWTQEPNHHISSLTGKLTQKYNVKKPSGDYVLHSWAYNINSNDLRTLIVAAATLNLAERWQKPTVVSDIFQETCRSAYGQRGSAIVSFHEMNSIWQSYFTRKKQNISQPLQ